MNWTAPLQLDTFSKKQDLLYNKITSKRNKGGAKIMGIKKNKYDFIKLEGLPLGVTTYGMRVKALEVVCKIKSIIDTEIWGYLIDRPEIFDIKRIKITDKLNRPELRLTLDYDEDYELINNIYFNIPFKKVLNLYKVIDYLNKNPEIAKINRNCVQLDLDKKVKEEINEHYKENLEEIKKAKKEICNEI